MRSSEPPIHGRHLVIVHDVDGGRVTGALNTWRRMRGRETEPCALCALTRGIRGFSPRWQSYLDALPEPWHRVTRDQWRADHAASHWRTLELPAILLQTGPRLQLLVSASQIRDCATVKDLTKTLDAALLAAHTDSP